MDVFGFGFTLLGIGMGVYASVKKMNAIERKRWTITAISLMVVGAGMVGYSFIFSRGVEAEDTKAPPSINQTITNSPGGINVLGDVTVNPSQDRRITKTDEFIRALRAVGPMAVKLEHLEDRDAGFLFAQLYHLVVASAWTAEERAQVMTTPWAGVHVAVRDIRLPPPAAVKLVEQLQNNGIVSGLVPESNPNAFQGTAFIIRIGYRPRDNKK